MRLRVHHLFCSALYGGKGYSEAFCGNMQKIVRWLWEEGDVWKAETDGTGQDCTMQKEADDAGQNCVVQKWAGDAEQNRAVQRNERTVELTAEPDEICAACPNLGDKGCLLDDNHVVSKDEALAQALGLETGRLYAVPELLQNVEQNLTADIFETSCRSCEWYAQGLCHYEELVKKYRSRKS